MTLYTYKAISDTGQDISGEIDADSKQHAMELISQMGHFPESLKKKTGASDKRFLAQQMDQLTSRVDTKELILYTMQFKTLLQAGVTILQIFQILEEQTDNKKLKSISADIRQSIHEGSSMFDAFSKHDTVFSNLYISLIKAGEVSGSLPEILGRLVFILEHEEQVRSDIRSAMRYPIIVLGFLVVAFFILLTFVVPKFVALFEDAGIDLPLPTRICMFLHHLVSDYWYVLLFIVVSLSLGLFQVLKTDKGQLIKDVMLMKIPVVGRLLEKSAMSRFASIFSILQASGVTVLESIRILKETIDNQAIAREFDRINELMTEGRGISAPLENANHFPSLVVNMVAIGEESGNLDTMLNEISKHYDVEVEYATKSFSDALGPALVVGLAVVVGFFAFAIFLPMWDLTKMVN